MTRRDSEAKPDELGDDPGQVGSDSGGQSGDTQGLSSTAEDADESVEELVETGQDYEAEVISGIERAADHPEKEVHVHTDWNRTADGD
ncbi:MAG TPA: hypothetical protein VN851_16165 [Thermoanaerobaculia bacterium]|nr:hypothetical protein [Thermoanaerobaculia bacterium]